MCIPAFAGEFSVSLCAVIGVAKTEGRVKIHATKNRKCSGFVPCQRQRKRPGGAVGSRPARKRSRLLPSSAGGTSQTEPRDLEESGAPAFEPGENRNCFCRVEGHVLLPVSWPFTGEEGNLGIEEAPGMASLNSKPSDNCFGVTELDTLAAGGRGAV